MHRRVCIESLEIRVLLSAAPAIKLIDGVPVATIEWRGQQVEMLAGRWMVQLEGYSGNLLDQQAAAAAVVQRPGSPFTMDRHLGTDGLFLLNAPIEMPVTQVLTDLSNIPGFVMVEPDFRYELQLFPNDPNFSTMWGLHNTGQSGGVVDADIDAPEAWDISTGSSNVVVGVVDSGIDYNHPDLAANIWTNSLEIPGNGIDDDGNGYIDDVRGWDWWGNGTSPGIQDNDPADQNNHGTHVAGTIGAKGNNGVGVVGVNWDVKLIPLKIGGPGSSVSGAAAVAAMYYVLNLKNRAVDPVNVRVTNHSWGGGGFDSSMNSAIAAHANAGILTVAAAGNNGTNNDSSPFYPASYNQPNVISVGNMTRSNVRNTGSNYGLTSVDLFAPGTSIMSTVRTTSGSYNSGFTGTSMASPHVAGVAALAWSVAPNATYQQVRDAIFQGVDVFPAYTGFSVTGGRLNAFNTLSLLNAAPAVPAQPSLAPGSDTGVSSSDNITRINTPTFVGSGATAGHTIRIYADGVEVGSNTVAPNGSWSVTTSVLADGVRQITSRAQSGPNLSGASPALAVTIDTLAPTMSTPLFNYASSPHFLALSFSKDVGPSIGADSFEVQNASNPGVVSIAHVYDATTNNASVSFPNDAVLGDAHYTLTVRGSGVGALTDIAGNPLGQDVTFPFFFLMGDANHDGVVNLADFNIVAANFGQSPRDFTQGDFNYDGTVNLADFNLLASRFGASLAPAVTSAPARGTFGDTPIRGTGTGLRSTMDDVLA